MKVTTSTGRSRPLLYLLVIAAIALVVVLIAKSTPGLLTASALPFLALLLICFGAMLFMMRAMSGPPR